MTKLEELLEWMDDAEYAPSYGELREKIEQLITEEHQVKNCDLADVVCSVFTIHQKMFSNCSQPDQLREQRVDESDEEEKHNMAACMLSILDSLKLYDTNSLELDDETLSEMMFRKMKGYNIDLNKELGFTHLEPVTKPKPR